MTIATSDLVSNKCRAFDITVYVLVQFSHNIFDLKLLLIQGCALREITRNPKCPNYEIQGAQHKAYMKEIRLSGRPKAKVSRLRHLGTLRAQPCDHKIHNKSHNL